MGGKNETTVPKEKTRARAPATATRAIGHIRVHENQGEVHFHDDAAEIKVAIPAAAWYNAWNALSSGAQRTFSYLDPTHESLLTIDVSIKGRKKNPRVDLDISVKPAALSASFEALKKFST